MKYLPSSAKKMSLYREDHKPSECPILCEEFTDAVIDHSHPKNGGDGCVRGVISGAANILMGKFENAFDRLPPVYKDGDVDQLKHKMLLRMAAYIMQHKKNKNKVLHPVGARDLLKRFKRFTVEKQVSLLEGLRQAGHNVDIDEVLACKNTKERALIYEKTLKEFSL